MDANTQKRMNDEVDAALRSGNPDDAARVIMTYKGCSLDAARGEVKQLLVARAKK